MSTEEKVALVASVREEYGLAPALAAVELPKSTWYYHRRHKVSYEEKYAHIRPLLEEIARRHPSYGIPRITIELRETHDWVINHKVISHRDPVRTTAAATVGAEFAAKCPAAQAQFCPANHTGSRWRGQFSRSKGADRTV